MKKDLAMKCTQEQFDAIKDKLAGFKIIERITYFHTENYLVNCFRRNMLTNLNRDLCLAWTKNIHETWNEEIFLESCGIETEKTFKGSELQFWNYFDKKWENCHEDNKYRLKPDNSKEIAELERQIEILKNK